MEKPTYRAHLERVLEKFGGVDLIQIKDVAAFLGVTEAVLKGDKGFPLKRLGYRYYCTAVGLAKWMSD